MRDQILLVSDVPEDYKVFQAICQEIHATLVRSVDVNEIQQFFQRSENFVAVFDSENQYAYDRIKPLILKSLNSNRIFSLSSSSFQKRWLLDLFPEVGHFFYFQRNELARTLYSKILHAVLNEGLGSAGSSGGIARYFEEGTPIRSLTIKESKHKGAVLEAIQKILLAKGVSNRIALSIVHSVDELILNALLVAPHEAAEVFALKKKYLKEGTSFELFGKEQIEIKIGTSDEYMAVSIIDQYGSFTRTGFVSGTKAGTGFRGILKLGLSLLLVCKPEVFSEVTLFFKLTQNNRDFKLNSFQFLSTVMP